MGGSSIAREGLTFEDQGHEGNHRGLHFGDDFSVAFMVPAGGLAFHRRSRHRWAQCTPRDVSPSLGAEESQPHSLSSSQICGTGS